MWYCVQIIFIAVRLALIHTTVSSFSSHHVIVPSYILHPLQVQLVDLLLLGVCVLVGTSGGNTGLVVEGLTIAEGVLQVLDFACETHGQRRKSVRSERRCLL